MTEFVEQAATSATSMYSRDIGKTSKVEKHKGKGKPMQKPLHLLQILKKLQIVRRALCKVFIS